MEQVMLNEDTGDGELFPALWHEEEVPSGIRRTARLPMTRAACR